MRKNKMNGIKVTGEKTKQNNSDLTSVYANV